jgi:hypothetical protein
MQLFVLAVRDERNQLIGVAPWYRTRTPGWGRVIQFLGSGDVCSEYLSLLSLAEHARDVSITVANWLTTVAQREWDVLDLPAIDPADAGLRHLREEFSDHGHAIDGQPDARCWRVELPETWDKYLADFSKSRRDRYRYLLRRLSPGSSSRHFRFSSICTRSAAPC